MSILHSLYMLDDNISELKMKLKELEKSRKTTLETILYLGTVEDGSYALHSKTELSRSVNIHKFKDAVGPTWVEYADVEVSIKSADNVLGESELDAVCDVIEEISYSVERWVSVDG